MVHLSAGKPVSRAAQRELAAGGPQGWFGLVLVVATNLLPLAAVFWLGWSLWLVFLFYWLETAIMGALAILFILVRARGFAKALGLFFLVHLGGFLAVHLIFIGVLFGPQETGTGFGPRGFGPFSFVPSIPWRALIPVAAGLLVQHGAAFVQRVISGERPNMRGSKAGPDALGLPYGRIFVMQFAIIGGGWGIVFLGTPVVAVALLILGKTAAEVALWLRARKPRNDVAVGDPSAAAVAGKP